MHQLRDHREILFDLVYREFRHMGDTLVNPVAHVYPTNAKNFHSLRLHRYKSTRRINESKLIFAGIYEYI